MKRFFVRSVSAALTLSVMVTGLSSCAQKDSTATGSSASSEVTAQSSDVSAETSESTGSSETSDSGADTPVSYTIDNIRRYVVGVDEPVAMEDGSSKVIINFDNAATTPALKPVMDEVNSKLETYGSIGRGYSVKSNISTEIYDNTREKVLSFVNADPEKYTCVYVNNTTDGLNKLASALVGNKNDVVLATRMEHHANDLSWRERCKVIYAEVDEQGRVKYDELEKMLSENKVKYVAVTAASNVTGYVTDVHRVARMAHEHGALIIVDGAQIVAHRSFSMLGSTPEENIDFLVFSAHKMYSPYGGGAIVGLSDVLNEHMPTFYGGGIVDIVSDYNVTYKEAPELYEAGSPNYPGVVGLGKAIDILKEVGFDSIQSHEQVLVKRLIDGLSKMDNVIIYGDTSDLSDRVGVVTFNFSDANTSLLATKLSKMGSATRRGAFCAHPYVWRLMGIPDNETEGFIGCDSSKTPGMIRASFGIYNTEAEVDEFLKMVDQAHKEVIEEVSQNIMLQDIPAEY